MGVWHENSQAGGTENLELVFDLAFLFWLCESEITGMNGFIDSE